ncbi:MAG TPA: tetratricopeptide repeat protein [Pyrinomonadaceae bacterium]
MAQSRLEIFEAMAREQPDDAMISYGLASEYVKIERWSEAATALRNVVRVNPDFTAAYQMLGTALINQGQTAEARAAWAAGIEAANRMGAWKARQHMEGLLASIHQEAGAKNEAGTEFCNESS